MQFLPIDYYILLQDNFHKSKFEKTPYVLFSNLPLLNKRKSASGLNVVKPIAHIDLVNTNSKEEAGKILNDELASEELITHLEKRFGQVDNFFFINYKPNQIIQMYSKSIFNVKVNELEDFEKSLDKKISKKKQRELVHEKA